MTDITLWGRLNSGNVQKAVWVLEELGLAYRHVALGGPYHGLDDPAYLAMNPNGLVPTLRDRDLVVWESHAIVRYLSAAYGSGLLFPLDPRERAIVDQWTDWTATTFQPAWISVFWLLVRTPAAKHDGAAIDRAIKASIRCYSMLDRRLGEAPFLGGEGLTYADIVAGASMYRWMTMPVDRPSMPNLEAWYARLDARPAFRKAICVSYDDLVGRLSF